MKPRWLGVDGLALLIRTRSGYPPSHRDPRKQPHACIYTTMQRTIPVCNSEADLEYQLTIQPLPNKINPKPLTSNNADGGGIKSREGGAIRSRGPPRYLANAFSTSDVLQSNSDLLNNYVEQMLWF